MRKFFREVNITADKFTLQKKYLGDGFIFFMEIAHHKAKAPCVYKFLEEIRDLTNRILKRIQDSPWPRPMGFRMRLTGGWVDQHDLESPEYIGEAPNLARDLLYVRPGIGIIAHSGVIKRLTPSQIKKLGIERLIFQGKIRNIGEKEIGELWVLPIEQDGDKRPD